MDYRIQQLRYRLREEPESRVFYQLGEILRREGELEEAVEVLRTGLGHHPRYVAAWVALGRALNGAGQPEDAEKAFARALELDPENSVAARSIGDIAARRGDWVRAVKALKLARVLAPGGDSLDERIAAVEAELSARGMLEGPDRAPAPAEPPPPARPRPARRPPPAVVTVSDEDPFAVAPAGDTGVWELGEDVFTRSRDRLGADPDIGQGAEDEILRETPASREDVFGKAEEDPALLEGAEATSEVVAHGAAEALEEDLEDTVVAEDARDTRQTVPIDAAAADDDEVGLEVDDDVIDEVPRDLRQGQPRIGPETWSGPEAGDGEPEDEEERDELADELPLPTMTLARLALQQGDRDLAERTLLGVLERDPDHQEARSMLLALRSARAEPAITERVPRPEMARVVALRRWLDTVRLGSERST